MHWTIASDDIRKAAEDVRIRAEDMIPVEGEVGMWRLPSEIWEKMPEVYRLVRLYNKTRYGSIKERSEGCGLNLEFDGGWDILLLRGFLSVPRFKMRVAIFLPRPSQSQSGPPTVLDDSVPDETGRPSSPPKTSGPTEPRPQLHRAIVKDFPTMEQKRGQASENIASRSLGVSEGLTGKEIDANTLRQEPRLLITRRPPSFGVGDILELYDLDGLVVKDGFMLMVLMRYSVNKSLKANQDQGKDGGPSAPA